AMPAARRRFPTAPRSLPGRRRLPQGPSCADCLDRVPLHHPREAVEKESEIVRTGASFRMALEPERGLVGELDALKAAIEQRHVSDAHVARQARRVDGEPVIL